jgi:hypothetical protein
MNVCLRFSVFAWSCVQSGLRRASESYRLYTRFIISELILSGNRPESLIRQAREEEEEEEEEEKEEPKVISPELQGANVIIPTISPLK